MAKASLTREQYAAIKNECDLTPEIIKECLTYNPDTGIFKWVNERPEELQ